MSTQGYWHSRVEGYFLANMPSVLDSRDSIAQLLTEQKERVQRGMKDTAAVRQLSDFNPRLRKGPYVPGPYRAQPSAWQGIYLENKGVGKRVDAFTLGALKEDLQGPVVYGPHDQQ
eukprot:TRINITY_DN10755_c0_g1_i1.p1 TRINITY_DN10755_c0_g1~~TRINITY_DN10755_c0_g1_i1.p1  ORF type:complete len:123 (-),score=26.90 TRINITY_DN10755_c0_g1_i1:88-435(-)